MPNPRILEEKKKVVEELTGKLRSKAGVFVDYSGISVNEDTAMRVKLREANINYTVIKNTLMRFAINNVGYEELDPILNGTTSLAISDDDPIAPARLIKEYADKFNGFFEIKAGFMDGKVLSASEVNALASIPALPVLQAQLLGTMLAPIASLAVVIKAIAEKGGVPADAQTGVSAEETTAATVEEAPEPTEEHVAAAEETPKPAEEPTAAAEEAPAPTEEPASAAEEAPESTEEPVAAVEEAPTPTEEPAVADEASRPTEEPVTASEEASAQTDTESPPPETPQRKTARKAPAKAVAETAEEAPTTTHAKSTKKAPGKAPAKTTKKESADETE